MEKGGKGGLCFHHVIDVCVCAHPHSIHTHTTTTTTAITVGCPIGHCIDGVPGTCVHRRYLPPLRPFPISFPFQLLR